MASEYVFRVLTDTDAFRSDRLCSLFPSLCASFASFPISTENGVFMTLSFTEPKTPYEALKAIDERLSRTLSFERSMVGAKDSCVTLGDCLEGCTEVASVEFAVGADGDASHSFKFRTSEKRTAPGDDVSPSKSKMDGQVSQETVVRTMTVEHVAKRCERSEQLIELGKKVNDPNREPGPLMTYAEWRAKEQADRVRVETKIDPACHLIPESDSDDDS